MSFPRRTHFLHILPVMLAACLAPYTEAMQASATAPSAVPSTGVVQPTVAVSVAPAARPSTVASEDASLSLLGRLAAGPGPLPDAVLVIPGKPLDPQAVGQIAEDLSIMSRIIQKNALAEYQGAGGPGGYGAYRDFVWISGLDAIGPDVLFPAPDRPKPMYLGGYGAVFFIQINYPLLPPPQTPQEQPATQQEDPIWAQTKRDVLEPQANVVLPQEAGKPAEPYSRELVDTLRNALITTMKHATNIRVLEPSEWIAIVVQGPAAVPQMGQNPPTTANTRPVVGIAVGKTMLTLRATKADVDQYAKGQLNQQQFEQRLQIVTY